MEQDPRTVTAGGGGAQKFLVAKRLTEEGRGGNERAVARGYLCL